MVPEAGKANQAVLKLLSKALGVPKSRLEIVRGETETGVTTMQMDAGLDTGAMLVKKSIAIGANETAGELHDRLARVGREAMDETIVKLLDGSLKAEAQDDTLTSYAPMPSGGANKKGRSFRSAHLSGGDRIMAAEHCR